VNYWTGEEGKNFEQEFARFCGASHGVALANGSLALEAALMALGIGPGDDVLVTPRSFFASVGAVVLSGARPVFADVDRDSQNVYAESLAAAMTRKTRAILLVHLAGWPCNMDEIVGFASAHDLLIIEDCAQAHGAEWKGSKVGSFGHASAFSFCQDKIITTGGEGGMLLTSDESVWNRVWSYKDHGKSWDAVFNREHAPGFRWLHESFGTNWRMTEMQAAIGRIQLEKLDNWLAVRRRNASVLVERLSESPCLRIPVPPEDVAHAWYKFYAFIVPERLKAGWSRDRIIEAIADQGVPCFSGSCPEIYQERAFDDNNLRPQRRLPVAQELGESSVMFLVDHTLSIDDMHRTAGLALEVLETATN
jgi:dTDP-4-amino-4,6-dideoxygalactose transaminase